MKPDLKIIDYQALLVMHQGKHPAWDANSLRRCVEARLVTQSGDFLTNSGVSKATALQNTIDRLKAGWPLEARTVSRSEKIHSFAWNRMELEHEEWSICPQAMIKGKLQAKASWLSLVPELRSELYSYKSTQAMKLMPYAVQIDEFGKQEFICFCGVTERNKLARRIQSVFYDYIIENFNTPTFWSWDHTEAIVVKRGTISKTHKFGGVTGIIQGVKLDRPFPPRSNCYGMVTKIATDTPDQRIVVGGDYS